MVVVAESLRGRGRGRAGRTDGRASGDETMQGDISRLSRSLTHLSSHWYAFSSFFPSPTPSPKKDAAGHRRCSTSIDYSLVPDSLCLSVLKLDGSSFGTYVVRTAA